MKSIKIRHLRVIEEIYRTGSIKNAGTALHLTSAAVSKACLEIEEILGVKIFIRSKSGMIPTSICDYIIKANGSINKEIKDMYYLIKSRSFDRRTIKIGFQAPALEEKMMLAVTKFKNLHADINVSIEHGYRPNLIRLLKNGDLDFIFIDLYGIKEEGELIYITLHSDGCFVASRNEIYTIPEAIENWNRLKEMLWIIPQKGLSMRDRFDNLILSLDLPRPYNTIEYNSRLSLDILGKNIEGYFLIPGYIRKNIEKLYEGPDRIQEIDKEHIRLDSGLVWSSNANHDKIMASWLNIFSNK